MQISVQAWHLHARLVDVLLDVSTDPGHAEASHSPVSLSDSESVSASGPVSKSSPTGLVDYESTDLLAVEKKCSIFP